MRINPRFIIFAGTLACIGYLVASFNGLDRADGAVIGVLIAFLFSYLVSLLG